VMQNMDLVGIEDASAPRKDDEHECYCCWQKIQVCSYGDRPMVDANCSWLVLNGMCQVWRSPSGGQDNMALHQHHQMHLP